MKNLRLAIGLGTVAVCLATAGARAQQGPAANAANDDPANLKGERVQPLRGDEIPENVGAKALWQNLLKLKTRASLLMIVAHPDDEDGGMLTYEVRGQGVRAGMLTLTRGEGGQNLMSADFNDALGLVRTEELLAADQYSGIEQMFGTEVDFGFSKTREEALAQWGHDRVLYDAVRAVRLFRPLVVTSVFVGAPTDGHGHHQVAGEMAQEVFAAAGDPKVFPEMGLPPWSPLKVYERVPRAIVSNGQIFDYATGKYVPVRFYNYVTKTWIDHLPETNVVIHEGEMSDKLGMSYVQFAREGLGLQKTQIGGGVRRGGVGGAFDVAYHRWDSSVSAQPTEKSFFDGVDVSLAGIAALAPEEKSFLPQGLAKLQASVDAAVSGYSESAPEKIAPELKDALVTVRGLIAEVSAAQGLSAEEKYNLLHELRVKEVQANDALAEAIGLRVDAKLAGGSSAPIPGEALKVQVKVAADPKEKVDIEATSLLSTFGLKVEGPRIVMDGTQAVGIEGADRVFTLTIPASAPATRPYFSRPDIEQPYYNVSNAELRNAPRTPSPLVATVKTVYDGIEVDAAHVVEAANSQPATVVPAVSVAVVPGEGILLPGAKSVRLSVAVHADAASSGTVRLKLPQGWASSPVSAPFQGEQTISFDVTRGPATDAPVTVTAIVTANGKEYSQGYRMGGYDARTSVAVYKPAAYRTRAVDVKVAPGLRVAYLEGTGDDVPAYLKEMGVPVTQIDVSGLSGTNLADYNVVIFGVRSFTVHGDLVQGAQALLDFVKAGGTAIVQYDTTTIPPELTPYPLTLGGDAEKVVEEDSKVVLTPGASPVLRWPNLITEKDFNGWVEERGHGFMRSWDARYEAPTEMHDAGQDPQRGGLLVAKYGKGYYVYCAFALYRQMPESVPGAYRLFANMLSLGKAPTQ